ncbi:MAG: DUF6061 family protein [Eubacteriales bacterium]|nr:DUF6061 family protein [Eubacteriales bacterium]MDD3882259.1 DUF6061 family protein [Eubacteriales bacterium]MDD4512005.1 DUF6061 family protein [Eubacteriales bacterium]
MKAKYTCEYNMDTGCVEIRVPDEGLAVDIDCDAVERSVAENRFDRSELDYLIYNDPCAYAELVLCDKLQGYLAKHTFTI